MYGSAWSVDVDMSLTGSVGLLSLLIQMLASSSVVSDLTAFQHSLRLISLIFAGLADVIDTIFLKVRFLLLLQGLQ